MNFSDLPDVIELRQPLWLLLSLIPFVFLFLHYLQAQSQLPGSHFDNNMRYWYIHQQPSLLFQQRQSFIIEILFWLAFSLSLAGPEYAESQNHSVNKHGDIFLVVLDASASMNSRDEQPSRLLRAKSEILLLSDKLKPADRLGVLLFSGSSHLLFPPTADRQAIDFFVQQIRGNLLPVAGTNIISALAETRSQLALFDDTMAKYVILISDGDIDNEEIVLEKISGLKLNLAVN
ncbi:MAG: VWA domain-containing protein, partial [Gammaproteobacteria bacterium]|nr:VWA domain-containing protein [Gammaproteobacteria bacterium]